MAERFPWKTGTEFSGTIYVADSADAAVTGLLTGNFTKRLAASDVNSAGTVTVTEVDSVNLPGVYKVTFTPNAAGKWFCYVSHATHNPRGWTFEIQAYTTDPLDIAATAVAIATETMTIDLADVESAAAFRTLAGAIAKLVNKVAVADSTLTVYKTNDTTAFGTQAVTTDSTANPITAVDTA